MRDANRDDTFTDIESALRELTPDDGERLKPPTELWTRIESALADELVGGTSSEEAAEGPHRAAPGAVVSLDHHRRNRFVAIAFGAAAALIVVIAGAVVVSRNGDDGTVVARAMLTHEVDFDAVGATSTAEAELIDDGSGHYRLQLSDADLPASLGEPADLELWLIEPDDDAGVADLVSLGVVDPDDPGTFAVPDDYDPSAYFVVDISVEPHDGDADHSGRSILRGPLQQA